MSIKYIFLRLCLFIISAYLFFMTSFLFVFIDDKVYGFLSTFNFYLFFALFPTILLRYFLMKYFRKFEISDDSSFYKKFEIILNKTSKIFSITTMVLMSITLLAYIIMNNDQSLGYQSLSFFNEYGLMIGLIITSLILYISKGIKPYVIII